MQRPSEKSGVFAIKLLLNTNATTLEWINTILMEKIPYKKFDATFVRSHRSELQQATLNNAKRHKRVAEILIKHQEYPDVFFHSYTALEELAKAKLLEENNISDLKQLVNHPQKAIQIAQVSAQQYGFSTTQDWEDRAKQRYVNMREDSIYSRLKPTTNNEYAPNNRYWKKRALVFYRFLSGWIKK